MSRHYIIPIFVPHSGCPHDCIFCNQKKITGKIESMNPDEVEDIINTHLTTINRENSYVEVSFFGGSFTGIPIDTQKNLLEVANKYFKRGLIDNIRLSTRPDYINKDILDHLREYNVGIIELGVQSLDEDVLHIAERGHSIEDVYYASRLIKEYRFTLGLQMMVGLPGDTLEKDINTAKGLIELKADFVRIYPALTIKDTYMEHLYKVGRYIPYTIDEAVDICKQLYLMFTKSNIPIVRLGLQATEQINIGCDVVAGPFHPSFRELVESAILNDMMNYVIDNFYSKSNTIEVFISPRNISKLYADKKRYFNENIRQKSSKNIVIRQEYLEEDMELGFYDGKKRRNMSIKSFADCIS